MRAAATALLVLMLGACATGPQPSGREAIVRAEIQPEPTNYAWWLRVRYAVQGTALRGIPVAAFDPGWCAAGELAQDAFPDEAHAQDRWLRDGIGPDSPTRFSLTGEFGSGQRLAVLLGVYDDCRQEPGLFLAALAPGRDASTGRVIQVETFPPGGGFLYLEPDWASDGFRTISCFECDDMGRLWLWDPRKGRFIAQPYEEEVEL